MFHAVIRTDTQEPLRLSGEASPYNLQVLRDHLVRRGPGTRVEVRLANIFRPALDRVLRDLHRFGVVVVVEP
jgi:hypothetical protein